MELITSAVELQPSDWGALLNELDQWSGLERIATFWWRDDDVTQPSQSLDRLLKIACGIPVALAVIPAIAEPALADRLESVNSVSILQHGLSHVNHAKPGEKKAEFGCHRSVSLMKKEIIRGAKLLRNIFFKEATSILVPPWNRIADDLITQLPKAGISALSTIGPTNSKLAIAQVNTHVDIIDWRGNRKFRGRAALDSIINHLSRRRLGEIDPAEATGLLTHHINHDESCWNFVTELLVMTKSHSAARWISIDEALRG